MSGSKAKGAVASTLTLQSIFFVDHFGKHNDVFVDLLELDLVMMHLLIVEKSRVEHRPIGFKRCPI
ncbi:hypothetical protein LPH50_04925 [Xylella taiwanensis]|uniref:Uncharacterized protein n=1 Tax=Xylella taiwanensis TaxID=1444770 RepID=A0ABS8TU05_9GAMM|nr:hypothetical protein [Xylella taiwanensis]MCD8455320.1 hypothetical protein [Xylella taiwanensis]MCD8457725.1 hypothetical protein [Xylella taiwanensis]MCD8459861.1 hypothetical protein [Xylella taiwanensis]MCD8464078.1 hypothetical protein [Xylella taiwanensis]MCD8464366.1 hypothetical protein [Xylella taiwanensis]